METLAKKVQELEKALAAREGEMEALKKRGGAEMVGSGANGGAGPAAAHR